MNKALPQTIKWLAILAGVSFIGCQSVQKATDYLKKKDALAELCADTYPVKTVTDSTGYKKSLATIDSIINATGSELFMTMLDKANLEAQIELLLSRAPDDCDSLYESVYRLAADCKAEAKALQARNAALVIAARNVKPVHDTVENTARVAQFQNTNSKLSGYIVDLTRERDTLAAFKKSMRGKVHIPWWWLVIAAAAGVVVWKFRKLLPF